MKQSSSVRRVVTSVGQHLYVYWEKVKEFKIFIIIEIYGIPRNLIGNMDEVIVRFDIPVKFRITECGLSEIEISTVDNE